MSKAKWFINFVGLGSFYGVPIGFILGILDYLIVFQFSISIFTLYFVILGIICGSVLGVLDGMILYSILIIMFPRSNNHFKYKLSALVVPMIVSGIIGYTIFHYLTYLYAETKGINVLLVILLPTVLASLGSGYVSHLIFRYYICAK